MKYPIKLAYLLVMAAVLSGCNGNTTPTPAASATESPPASVEPSASVEDQASLIAALEGEGATVEIGEPITQAFLIPEGHILKVNGADVQVFEYEGPEAMESEASRVAPDGGSIGTTMVTWIDAPHFYKSGRLIVLYVGSDATILGLLEKALDPQFAGR